MDAVLAWVMLVLAIGGTVGGCICVILEWDDAQIAFLVAAGIGFAMIFLWGQTRDYEMKNQRMKVRAERQARGEPVSEESPSSSSSGLRPIPIVPRRR